MLRKEFINVLHQNLDGYSKKQCEVILDGVAKSILQVLINGDEVRIKNFGTFKTKTVKAHDGVHPITHNPIRFPTKVIPFLKFSNKAKESIAFANKQ